MLWTSSTFAFDIVLSLLLAHAGGFERRDHAFNAVGPDVHGVLHPLRRQLLDIAVRHRPPSISQSARGVPGMWTPVRNLTSPRDGTADARAGRPDMHPRADALR